MTYEEIARRKEWNRIVAWLKPPQLCQETTLQRRAVNLPLGADAGLKSTTLKLTNVLFNKFEF
jgi:hypothetical protein